MITEIDYGILLSKLDNFEKRLNTLSHDIQYVQQEIATIHHIIKPVNAYALSAGSLVDAGVPQVWKEKE